MIIGWNERQIPAGSIRIKSALNGKYERGTIGGELLDFATQFLSFGMSFTARQIEAVHIFAMASNKNRGLRGAAYIASLAGSVLCLGAGLVYTHVIAIRDGKDPQRYG
ncbi:MAG: hypothetical protein U5K75_00180 [Ahrensia sp.]|nr:hypothetical protein [Ahrensia sp.]